MPRLPFGNLGRPLSNRSQVSFRNVRTGIISAQELVVAGGTKGVIRSQNYDPTNELGWAIFGDGSAFFYGDVTIGEDAVVMGDVLGSWDGADPVDLSSIDTTATTGFALDSSVGTGQFMNSLFAAGIGFMDVLNSNTQVGAIGGNNDELLINGVGSKTVRIQTLTGGTIEMDPGSGGATVLNSDTEIAGDLYLSSGGVITTNPNPSSGDVWIEYRGNDTGAIVGMRNSGGTELVAAQQEVTANGFEITGGQFLLNDFSGSPAVPGLAFGIDTDTGIFRHGTNQLGFAAGGNDAGYFDSSGHLRINGGIFARNGGSTSVGLGFQSDTDTGFSRPVSNEIWVVTGGTTQARFDGGLGQFLVQNTGSQSRPDIGFWDDTDTGMMWQTTGQGLLVAQAAISIEWHSNNVYLWGARNNTTGSAANTLIQSADGRIFRSTSLRAHKSRITYNVDYLANIDLKPAKFYRKDDKKWWYGFIAEDLTEQDPLLGEHDFETGELTGYDLREVVAVLAAKVNQLEAKVAALS